MGDTIQRRISALLLSNRKHARYVAVLACMALAVVLGVTAVLRQQGQAKTYEVKVLDCQYSGSGAHTHDASCYDADGNLVCPLEERTLHTHDESCYASETYLVCGQEEGEGAHWHTDECYDEEGNLVCGLEESEGHVHTDACWQTDTWLACGLEEVTEEHVHGEGCFKTVTVTEDDPEPEVEPEVEGGSDSDATTKDPAAENNDSDDAVDTPAPAAPAKVASGTDMPAQEFAGELKAIDENGNEYVKLVVSVKAPEGAFEDGTTMRVKAVDAAAYADKVNEAVKAKQGDNFEAKSVTAVDITFVDKSGAEVEPAKKIEVKITDNAVKDVEQPTLVHVDRQNNAEVVDGTAKVNADENDTSTGNENTIKFDADKFSPYFVTEVVEVVADTTEAEEEVEPMTFEGSTDDVAVTVEAPAGAFPEGTTMTVEAIPADEVIEQVEAAVQQEGAEVRVKQAVAVDIKFWDAEGNQVEPLLPVSVRMSAQAIRDIEEPVLVHVPDGDEAEVLSDVTMANSASEDMVGDEDTFVFDADQFSPYVIVELETITTQVITASGDTYEISVTYGPEAGIPSDAILTAEEIVEGTEEYDNYFNQSIEAIDGADDLTFARFFDVTILSNGEKVEPLAPVEVTIDYTSDINLAGPTSLKVVHFADEGTEVIDVEVYDELTSQVVYEQSSFSVIGTVAATAASGWPTQVGQYIIVLEDVDNPDHYYAIKQDGTLQRVKYFNHTISFVGAGTTNVSYADDFLWYMTTQGSNQNRWFISDEYYSGSGTMPASATVIDFYYESGFSTGTARTLQIRDGKIYCSGPVPGTTQYTQYTFSANGGNLTRVGLYDESASPVLFVNKSTLTANDNESELYTQVDVDSLIELWKERMTQELDVDKTAEVYDYDNRIYRVDIDSSSGYYEISPSMHLEFVVDASRSMYFPAELNQIATPGAGSGNVNGATISNWLTNNGDPNKTYFVIADPNGAATVFALFQRQNQWYYVDSSNYNPPDSVQNVGYAVNSWNANNIKNAIYTTEITGYTESWNLGRRGKYFSRLEYLKLAVKAAAQVVWAVDPEAQIGITQFNAGVDTLRPQTKANAQVFYDWLDRISLTGGTNHALGLNAAYEVYSAVPQANRDHQQSVVFVTDGAPNVSGQSAATSWTNATNAANRIKMMQDKYGNYTRMYTLGLSLTDVGDNASKLADLAGVGNQHRDDYAKSADNAEQIVDAVTKIIEDAVSQVSLKGDVTDVIAPAFYPVDKQTGEPLAAGDWIDLDGNKATSEDMRRGQLSYDDATQTWKVTWTDQIFDWATTTAQGTIPGWHGAVFVKTQEDFLGGSGVATNESASVEARKYYHLNVEERDLPEDDPNRFKELETPYVNIDELAFTENSTSWTVYLGEQVDPKSEVNALFGYIKVKEVVDDDGKMTYALAPDSTEDGREEVNGRHLLTLADYGVTLSDADWNTLVTEGSIAKDYQAYGIEAGQFVITLEKTVKTGEDGLDSSPHATKVVGEEVEKYVLTVSYVPADAEVSNYHTGSYGTGRPGNDPDSIVSENVHVINVFAKRLQLWKTDMARTPITSDTATFVLYREARAGETGVDVKGLPGKYVEVETFTTDSEGKTNVSDYLLAGVYYLVETKTPDGFIPIGPVEVDVATNITNTYTWAIANVVEPATGQPIGWTWAQTATIVINGSSNVIRHGQSVGAAIDPNSDIETFEYDVINTDGTELPMTGGPGTTLYTIVGSAVCVVAVVMYGFASRRGRERRFD